MLNEHRTVFSELESDLSVPFLADAQQVGGILKKVTDASRINYAVLGNAVSHLHWHIIPRKESDPEPRKSPWSDPRPHSELDNDTMAKLIESVRTALDEAPRRRYSN